MRTHTRTALGAAALALIASAGGCGSGGPGTYLLDVLGVLEAEDAVAATVLPRPGR